MSVFNLAYIIKINSITLRGFSQNSFCSINTIMRMVWWLQFTIIHSINWIWNGIRYMSNTISDEFSQHKFSMKRSYITLRKWHIKSKRILSIWIYIERTKEKRIILWDPYLLAQKKRNWSSTGIKVYLYKFFIMVCEVLWTIEWKPHRILTWQIDIIFHSDFIGQLLYYFPFLLPRFCYEFIFLDGFRSIRCISVISTVGISTKLPVKSNIYMYPKIYFIIKIQRNESLELTKPLANCILCIVPCYVLYWYIFYVLFTYFLLYILYHTTLVYI